ncbi:MAG: hypothetical protein COW00_16870 [Bdellovibrio sp. CG12_big_fil_rev_8_21_14_0_65_39_13]|nr:MAG: hypothetical protein COW78_10160 [Bdellovibrio sp. CG22_combo_CG10-13_8_21_14_all_39_27]PIQ58278.1 MAG: hypothetical protein COW00_16870 [Bdellovibrio sp. CG12_big_fil_rev_8_21_14_0_65_39_13]PIR36687.1 MAG: hypothetical protein COV37_02390 [Bdellovibrio sp. CG11_big_fil_rev_8_21_14_0_20_39_38]
MENIYLEVGSTIMNEVEMSLENGKVGEKFELIDFTKNPSVYFKFISLGLMPNDIVTVTGRAPFGGPITLKHSSETYFALRLSEARVIQVKRIA